MSLGAKISISCALLIVGVYGGYVWLRVASQGPPPRVAPVVDTSVASADARDLEDFEFTERSGEQFGLEKMKGKIWVASFFFSSCPGNCRQMNLAIASLQPELIKKGVDLVSISVDPGVDTPEVLSRYADDFNADAEHWRFLTGPYENAEALGRDVFQVVVAPRDHSDRLVLVDGNGKVRGRYRATVPQEIELLRQKIDELLAERDVAGDEGTEASSSHSNGDPQPSPADAGQKAQPSAAEVSANAVGE